MDEGLGVGLEFSGKGFCAIRTRACDFGVKAFGAVGC